MNDEPSLGAHLISPRNGYSHHGIYVGSGRVIHYAGCANDHETGPVEETDLQTFAQGKGFRTARHSRAETSAWPTAT